MKNTAVIKPYKQPNVSSMTLLLWGRLLSFILVNPLPFALNIVIEDPFIVNCNDILEKQVISISRKKTFINGYVIVLILFTKHMRNTNVQLAHFSNLF